MARELKVPNIGDFEGVEVIDVLVKAGDRVAQGDSVITLESDKAAMDVPAEFAGTVKEVKVKAGDKVSEGDVILLAEQQAEDASADAESAPEREREAPRPGSRDQADESGPGSAGEEESSGARQSPAATARPPEPPRPLDQATFVRAHAGPSVRKLARELGVDLSQVQGSGRKGRITHEDVKSYVKAVMRGGGAGLPAVPEVDFSRFGDVERRALSRLKRIAGPRLQAAWLNAPHVTQHDEADITVLESVRKAMKPEAEARGVKLTPLAFLVHAVVLALQAYPDFNASLDPAGESLILKHYYHVGFAVDTSEGLVVPVLHDADRMELLAVAERLQQLGEKAREGKLRREDIEGGCFSISSLGSIGGTAFTPIINVPEVAILGVSRAQTKPVWNGREFEPRLMLPLSLSYDHRVIDGAQAVRFTRHVAETLETLRGLVH